jgi:hypothetical protein
MALASGTRIGPYEVVAPIGAGGMGEVWQSSVASHQSSVSDGLMTVAFRLSTEDGRLMTTSRPRSRRWR